MLLVKAICPPEITSARTAFLVTVQHHGHCTMCKYKGLCFQQIFLLGAVCLIFKFLSARDMVYPLQLDFLLAICEVTTSLLNKKPCMMKAGPPSTSVYMRDATRAYKAF